MLYSRENIFKFSNSVKYYGARLSFLLLILVLSFSSLNLISFYFFFEASLIPTLLIIIGWGYQPERLQAGIYFLFYTLLASLPLLVCLVYISWVLGSLDYFLISLFNKERILMFLGLRLAFLVKIPIFYTHL